MSRAASLAALRTRIAVLETGGAPVRPSLSFGDAGMDAVFPAGGLPLGCWHEVTGEGLEMETGAAPGAFVAALVRPLVARGAVVWVMRRDDLYAPGLAGLGFPADRLIQVRVRDEAQAQAALEDALASAGVAVAIGETGTVDLTAGRRLQLACEKRGATGFVIGRRPFGNPSRASAAEGGGGSAAATRWSVTPSPSAPTPHGLGLGPPRWRATLTRCRGGRTGGWILEMNDGPYPLRVVAPLGDRQLEASEGGWTQPVRRAG